MALDGSLNNANILDHIDILKTNINSDTTILEDSETSENANANTRAGGTKKNSTLE